MLLYIPTTYAYFLALYRWNYIRYLLFVAGFFHSTLFLCFMHVVTHTSNLFIFVYLYSLSLHDILIVSSCCPLLNFTILQQTFILFYKHSYTCRLEYRHTFFLGIKLSVKVFIGSLVDEPGKLGFQAHVSLTSKPIQCTKFLGYTSLN